VVFNRTYLAMFSSRLIGMVLAGVVRKIRSSWACVGTYDSGGGCNELFVVVSSIIQISNFQIHRVTCEMASIIPRLYG
jgi:hypothetical protein